MLKVDNSPTNNAMFSIMRSLLDLVKTKPSEGWQFKPTPEIMEIIWGMKDRAVTASKCAGMAQLMFEGPSRFGELSYGQVQNLLVWCLDYVYAYGLLSIEVKKEVEEILQETLLSLKDRSVRGLM